MESIQITQKTSASTNQYPNSGSESEAVSIFLPSKARIVQNQVKHFDIRNSTPRAIYN